MTEQEFKTRYNEIIDWYIKETDKITEKLKKENKIQGLDTNKDEYAQLYNEYTNKIRKLREKYNQ